MYGFHIVGYVSWAVVDDESELNLHREYFCRTESGEHSFCVDQGNWKPKNSWHALTISMLLVLNNFTRLLTVRSFHLTMYIRVRMPQIANTCDDNNDNKQVL